MLVNRGTPLHLQMHRFHRGTVDLLISCSLRDCYEDKDNAIKYFLHTEAHYFCYSSDNKLWYLGTRGEPRWPAGQPLNQAPWVQISSAASGGRVCLRTPVPSVLAQRATVASGPYITNYDLLTCMLAYPTCFHQCAPIAYGSWQLAIFVEPRRCALSDLPHECG